MTTKAPSMSWP